MKKITVLIVEDSALMRRELTRIIGADPELRVVGAASDGEEGLEMVRSLEPDVVTLDLRLPGMDGITCLQHIMIETPRPCVMISAYTGKDAVETFEALELGAVDFVEKPRGEISRNIEERAQEIVDKIKLAAGVNMAVMTRQKFTPVEEGKAAPAAGREAPGRVVVIGVSTGGPRTLMQIVPELPAGLGAPVVVIQHMPGNFTGGFARRLDQYSHLPVREAGAGEPLRDNVVYVAPGDYHLQLVRQRDQVVFRLETPAGRELNIPSVNKAMNSAIDLFGERVVGVVLTGMGDDGANAMERLHELGGQTIAESEQTAVIYGMPREAIERGAAGIVAPAPEIAARIMQVLKRKER